MQDTIRTQIVFSERAEQQVFDIAHAVTGVGWPPAPWTVSASQQKQLTRVAAFICHESPAQATAQAWFDTALAQWRRQLQAPGSIGLVGGWLLVRRRKQRPKKQLNAALLQVAAQPADGAIATDQQYGGGRLCHSDLEPLLQGRSASRARLVPLLRRPTISEQIWRHFPQPPPIPPSWGYPRSWRPWPWQRAQLSTTGPTGKPS